MADLILKKTDFLKNLSKKQKMSSGEEGSMAAVIDAAKLRQVVDWMNNVEELINSKLSSYLPLSGGNIDPGPLEYCGKSVFTNDSYIVDSRLSSNIVRIGTLNNKVAELKNLVGQISVQLEDFTTDAIEDLSGTVDDRLTAAIQDLENEISEKLAGVYRYKGTVTYVEELADLEVSAIRGDCWNILSGYRDPSHISPENYIKVNPGDNAVWNGENGEGEWDILAGIVDVSNFVEKEEVRELEERIGNSISEFAGNLDRKITAENERAVGVETILSSALDDLSGTREKTAILSQFATNTYVNETFATKQEVQETIDKVHTHDNLAVLSGITAEQVAAWDASEQNAKNYTDEQVNAVCDSLSNYISKEDAYNAIAPEISAYNNFLSASPDSIADIIEWNRGLHTALFNLVELLD